MHPTQPSAYSSSTTTLEETPGLVFAYVASWARDRRNFPFIFAAALYALTSAAMLGLSYRAASGHFIYALDDTYIGMAMAKNFAYHGVWGVTSYEFSSATSTPVFIALLSLIYAFIGPEVWVPLALSWIFGLASIYVASRMLANYLSVRLQTAALALMVLFTPLFVIGTIGMEHTLQLLLGLLFIERFAADEDSIWPLAGITFLMVGTRYEGLFMAFAACLILAFDRRWVRAAVVAVSAALPVSIYALLSVTHGGYWLPNSVAMKGAAIHSGGRIQSVAATYFNGSHLLFLAIALAVAFAATLWRSERRVSNMACLVAASAFLHLTFASIGWVFRYESYLVACCIVMIAISIPSLRIRGHGPAFAVSVLSVIAFALLLGRFLQSWTGESQGSAVTWKQPWQVATFLNRYYPQGSIAANDIGAINYLNDLQCLDLVGLANSDIFRAKRAGTYTTQLMDTESKARRVRVAIIYDSWFPSPKPAFMFGGPPIPASWIRVGKWKMIDRYGLIGDTVSFYGLTPEAAKELGKHLDSFAPSLPKEVTLIR